MDLNTAFELDRYQVHFDLREVPHYRFDVVVVGSGGAGSLAAMAAAEAGRSVAVLAKAGLEESNTRYAQGGLAAVLSEDDSFDAHVNDTLDVGCGLSERAVTHAVVHGGPDAVKRLLAMGTEFDRRGGALELGREGGHSHARIVHARGDATGAEIQRAVSATVAAHPDISSFANIFAIDILSDPDGRAASVLCQTERRELVAFNAKEIVLATGGAGQIFRETTNPVIATADGVAMGFRAGARVRDLEFVQFHPTCLYIAGAARVLISEIIRGAGGVLRDKHGVRFMPDFHERAELAPRDVVSRAVFDRMVATDDTSVYLDLSEVAEDPHSLFPGISRICDFYGIDIARDPIPVRPGAHYMIGGLEVDLDGRTSVPGLWAVGECTSTGLHGANRMGSNSLLEGIVLGERIGRAAAASAVHSSAAHLDAIPQRERSQPPLGVAINIEDLTYSLKSMMWRQMGVERSGAGLADAQDKLAFWMRALRDLAPEGVRAWELVNMLTVARLATLGAAAREESRGVHYRTDFTAASDDWLAHTAIDPVFEEGRNPTSIRAVELHREALQTTTLSAR